MQIHDIVDRLKHNLELPGARTSLLLYGATLSLAVFFGFLLGQTSHSPAPKQALVLANYSKPSSDTPQSPARTGLELDQMAKIRSEIMRLRVLFARLAELANVNTGEFDVDAEPLPWQEQSHFEGAALLNTQLAHISERSGVLERIFEERALAFDQRISGLPVSGGRRSSGYGFRRDPFDGSYREHLGVDYIATPGSPIYALADGIVTFSGRNGGYGNLVELEHVDGYVTRYAHNESNHVAVGERVKKGHMIARLGSTGRSTGAHVHVEVRLNGGAIDPTFFVR